jgi:uncharacterized protein (TIGR00369 family)
MEVNLNQHPTVLAYNSFNNFAVLVGMDYEILSEGNVNYYISISKDLLATPLAAHGGIIASLLDACLGVTALSTVCQDNKVVSTIEFSTRFFKPALENDELTAVGITLSKGKRIISCEAKVYNQHKELIASGNGTFNAYPKEKAGL